MHDEFTSVKREDGRKFATVSDDGARVYLSMWLPDGYSGRQAVWLVTIGEMEDLIDALAARVAKLKAKQMSEAA